jgi:hypothetical protein
MMKDDAFLKDAAAGVATASTDGAALERLIGALADGR